MFHNHDRRIQSRIYCVLITALLAAGNVFAEDDVADLDPDFMIPGVFRNLLDFLSGLFT